MIRMLYSFTQCFDILQRSPGEMASNSNDNSFSSRRVSVYRFRVFKIQR